MASINTLKELLRSQISLYTEIIEVLTKEKNAIVTWDFSETNTLLAKKEKLIHKEKLLEEARKSLAERVKTELNAKDNTLSSIIEVAPEEDKDELALIKKEFQKIVVGINNESMALKILYSTNIKVMNGLYTQLGILSSNTYDKKKSNNSASSVQIMG